MNNQDFAKNTDKKEGLAALCSFGPRVRFHFDNEREFFKKKSNVPVFSWHTKGDFTLPIIPFAVGVTAAAIALSCLLTKKTKS